MNNYGKIIVTDSGQHYVYNTATNQIITIDNNWYDSISKTPKDYEVFKKLKEEGYVVGKTPHSIVWEHEIDEYTEKIKTSVTKLVLEVTQECTLRCDYCIYSGNYSNSRTHSSKHMDLETIKSAIDGYAHHSTAKENAKISFYGGEALIHFDLIKEAVRYADLVFENKNREYSISTNGTTLSKDVLEWLNNQKNVSVVLTVNGNTHDKYRKYSSGKGSLSDIQSNINRIKAEFPNVWERTQFIANVSSLDDLLGIKEYYTEHIEKPPILITGINKKGGNSLIQDIIAVENSERTKKEVKELFYYDQNKYILPYFKFDISDIVNREMGIVGDKMIKTASCMPFCDTLFVSVDGEFGICEKVGVCCDLGNLDIGFNIHNITKVINSALDFFNNNCRTCCCFRLCNICFKDFVFTTNKMLPPERDFCINMQKYIEENLKVVCELAEKNPDSVRSFLNSAKKSSNQ